MSETDGRQAAVPGADYRAGVQARLRRTRARHRAAVWTGWLPVIPAVALAGGSMWLALALPLALSAWWLAVFATWHDYRGTCVRGACGLPV